MPARPCSNCGRPKSAPNHSRHYRGEDICTYIDNKTPGLAPMSEGMRNWRRQSGYDEHKRAIQGTPCQVVSPVCVGIAEDLHEPLTRGRSGGLRASYEIGGGIPACRPCNGYIGENPVWAAERGFLFSYTVDGINAAKEAKNRRVK